MVDSIVWDWHTGIPSSPPCWQNSALHGTTRNHQANVGRITDVSGGMWSCNHANSLKRQGRAPTSITWDGEGPGVL
jgi:hypothetical protein